MNQMPRCGNHAGVIRVKMMVSARERLNSAREEAKAKKRS